ncbi:DNA gyrase C-terminal beta-propeller domain-containing protein [Mycoplasma struthionis]|uniref:DNA gyrase C-terminal beta-propeller domain-containing protein n=1 Tax=Mycoplasma struthionis TaxID=538220 RepID=UPI001FE9F585|nr:DNA gyrase C-terminal beta-propeller domain-containing protein [Mycoplasma struthionis]
MSNEWNSYKIKEDDGLLYFDKINSLSKLVFFTNLGNFFVLDAHNLKDSQWKDLGIHISSYTSLETNERVIRVMEVISFNSYVDVILLTKMGYAKKVKISEFDSKTLAKTRICISFKNDDDELIDARIGNNEKDMFIILNNGMYYLINENVFSTPLALKAQGIKLLPKLQVNEKIFVKAFCMTNKLNIAIMITEGGYAKAWKMQNISSTSRTNRGSKLFISLKNQNHQAQSLEIKTQSLEMFYTDQNNTIQKFDLAEILKDKSSIDKLIKLNYQFLNASSLIEHLKIDELVDPSIEKQNEIKDEYEKKLANEQNLDLTMETTLMKRYYQTPIKFDNAEENNYNKGEQGQLFDEDFVDLEAKEKDVKKQLEALDNLDIDGLLTKVKQIRKK